MSNLAIRISILNFILVHYLAKFLDDMSDEEDEAEEDNQAEIEALQSAKSKNKNTFYKHYYLWAKNSTFQIFSFPQPSKFLWDGKFRKG